MWTGKWNSYFIIEYCAMYMCAQTIINHFLYYSFILFSIVHTFYTYFFHQFASYPDLMDYLHKNQTQIVTTQIKQDLVLLDLSQFSCENQFLTDDTTCGHSWQRRHESDFITYRKLAKQTCDEVMVRVEMQMGRRGTSNLDHYFTTVIYFSYF